MLNLYFQIIASTTASIIQHRSAQFHTQIRLSSNKLSKFSYKLLHDFLNRFDFILNTTLPVQPLCIKFSQL